MQGFFRPWPLAVLAIVCAASAGGHAGIALVDLADHTLTPAHAVTAVAWVVVSLAATVLWVYCGERRRR